MSSVLHPCQLLADMQTFIERCEQRLEGRRLLFKVHPLDENGHYEMEFAFLLRDGESRRVEHDRHTCCAFARATWLAASTT